MGDVYMSSLIAIEDIILILRSINPMHHTFPPRPSSPASRIVRGQGSGRYVCMYD